MKIRIIKASLDQVGMLVDYAVDGSETFQVRVHLCDLSVDADKMRKAVLSAIEMAIRDEMREKAIGLIAKDLIGATFDIEPPALIRRRAASDGSPPAA